MKVFNHIIIEITTNIIDFHFSYESKTLKKKKKKKKKRVDNMTTTKQTGSKFH